MARDRGPPTLGAAVAPRGPVLHRVAFAEAPVGLAAHRPEEASEEATGDGDGDDDELGGDGGVHAAEPPWGPVPLS
jgi:hypothetical protein